VTTRIAILVEGKTEAAFKPVLLNYLQRRLAGNMPKLDFVPQDGRIPKEAKLKRQVELLLRENDWVIALTDVYAGSIPRDFEDANDAKAKMQMWVGTEPRFRHHAAQYEFEAWLLAYWPRIQRLSGCDDPCPSLNPETVDHDKPPAQRLAEVFRKGKKRRYSKVLLAQEILRDQDLAVSAACCPELRAFLGTILQFSGGSPT
jgi:hypothetical protein